MASDVVQVRVEARTIMPTELALVLVYGIEGALPEPHRGKLMRELVRRIVPILPPSDRMTVLSAIPTTASVEWQGLKRELHASVYGEDDVQDAEV